MKLFSIKNLAMTGALSVAGLGLVGVGAHAVFTQNTASAQTITAGTMNVTLNSATASSGWNTDALTLASPAATGSSFVSASNITITNNGNIPVNEISYQLTDATNNGTLESETWACLYSDGYIYFNEPLTTVTAYGNAAEILSLAPGATDTYTLVLYAGTGSPGADCGGATTGYSASPWTSPDGQVIPHSYRSGASYALTPGHVYQQATPFVTPGLGGNSAAASLTNSAEGGSITPTFTAGFEG